MPELDRETIPVPVAVVGVAALFPGSADARGFWADILAGRDLVTDVPPGHWLIEDYYDPDPAAPDKTYCKRGAFLSPVPFDPMEFGLPPSSLPSTDASQVLALIVAQKVLEDASRGQFASMDKERISVILGVTSGQQLLNSMVSRLQRPVWVKALRESGVPEDEAQTICDRIAASYVPWQESSFPGLLGNVVAGRIANRFDLHGTNAVTDAACASSLAALSMALAELRLGESDLVITGGVDTMNDIFMYMCFSKTPALSPTGDCRPFSDRADGTLLGEGLGMLALKRLADAERDGDRIYAVVRGVGSSSDGRNKSVYAPAPEGQARALRRAYARAGYGPETVELVEAHGTGTKAGDAAELESLRRVFEGTDRPDRQWCALGSVKSQVGHTKAAAGVAGLFKVIMALHHKVLPPTIKVERPNPALDLERSAFYLSTRARPWIRDGAHPRRGSVSSFGFGGSNFHVALEEYVPERGSGRPAERYRTAPTELVLLSAPSPGELVARCRELTAAGGGLARAARESQLRFDTAHAARLAVVAASPAELAERLSQAGARIEAAPETPFLLPGGTCYAAAAAAPGEIAFLFPGQGSQYVGMGADVAMSVEVARAAWDRAAALPFDGERVDRVVFPPPVFTDEARAAQAERLTATEWAQPALGVQGVALLTVLRTLGVAPACVAGHSFGEVTALHAAGAFDEATLLRIARRRGELMRGAAAVPGAMTAVTCPREAVDDVLEAAGAGVVLANHNGPEQWVLSGETGALARAEEALAARGIEPRRLAVATAFHSPLVAPASGPFEEYLAGLEVAAPALDVYGNADAEPYPRDPDEVRRRLAAQIARPVRFAEGVEAMYARGVRTFVEVGAGSVLTELVGRILGGRDHCAVSLDRKGVHGLTALQTALGRLAVAGVAMDLSALWEGIALPEERSARRGGLSIDVSGTAYGKPYPPPGGAEQLPPPNPPRAIPKEAPVEPLDGPRAAAPPARPLEEPSAGDPPMAAAGARPAPFDGWLEAYQEAQRQTAEAHAAYQRATAESHLAFLRASEASFAGLAALLTGDRPAAPAPLPPTAEAGLGPVPLEAVQPALEAPAAAAVVPPPEAPAAGSPVEPAPGPAQPPASASAEPAPDLESLLLEVVAEKTGYPAEMLASHMELEADLGIDSIKRVEILSALSERSPGLREVKMNRFATLRTLGQIVEHLGEAGGGGAPAAVAPSAEAEPARNEDGAAPAVRRFAVRAVPAPPVGMALSGLLGALRVAVTDDGAGLADLLAAKLRERHVPADAVAEVPPDADAVVFLGGLRRVADPGEAIAVNREAFRAARAVAARFSSEQGGVFVTVQDTGGDFGLRGAEPVRAWSGGLAALARTAALEWPQASVKAIDCERGGREPEAVAAALCAELLEGGPTLEVGLPADGRRLALATVEAPAAPAASPRIDSASVVVASGGGRGVTAECLIALARAARPRIVLLGRTLVDGVTADGGEGAAARADEIRATLQAVEAAGSAVRYVAADVQDAAAVAAALDDVRREWGPVTALIHGAGVLADRRISDKTDEQFDRVFDTKVQGLRALLAATSEDPLTAVCLFSSVAARTGNPGQSDYAMANEVLNLVACAESARRGGSCSVRSIGWGPWDGGMVTPFLKNQFRQAGVPLIPVEAGAALLVAELAGADGDVAVLVAGAGGPSLLGADAAPTRRAEVRVDARSHAFLEDHRLGDTPLVPVVLALEWMLRAARACRPELTCTAIRDVRVLQGIRLDRFHDGGDILSVSCRQRSAGERPEMAVELRGRGGTLHYSGVVEMAARPGEAPPPPAPPEVETWTGTEVYDGHVLFHGERFQVIRSLDGVSRAGLGATVSGALEVGWARDSWLTDPALLDGGLQLAGLWTRHVLGGASLPMALGELRTYRGGLAEGPVRCVLHARGIHDAHSVCDISFADEGGAVIAEMRGVESVMRPGEGAEAGAAGPAGT